MTRPQTVPTIGLTLPCRFVSARDGDTVVVSILDGRLRPAIRLIGIDCPEGLEGLEAKHFTESTLEVATDLILHIPEPTNLRSLLANLTFDRIPGYIWLDARTTLNDLLVERNLARRV